MHSRTLVFLVAATTLMALAPAPARADAIHFNTDTGVMMINGGATTNFFGTTVQSSVVDGMMQFRFLGSLAIISSDVVTASGSRALSLLVGDNVTVAGGASLNFDAVGTAGRLGGGNGALGGGGGALGAGGAGGIGGLAGIGGLGGAIRDCNTFGCGIYEPGANGTNGATGALGSNGNAGGVGSTGARGSNGFNNSAPLTTPGTGGVAGGSGARGMSAGIGGLMGFGGEAGGLVEGGGPGTVGIVGLTAGSGGAIGGSGSAGGNGQGGTNIASGLILTGGAGGSSGGGGGGGGGGGAGAGGGGAGGGGGGGAGGNFFSSSGGGVGGAGGKGGNGGNGGNGSVGRTGGASGAGGGAVEIVAQGSIQFAGTISVRGANGINGSSAVAGASGALGLAGAAGAAGGLQPAPGGAGGNGGQGSSGGNGGTGGASGSGGHGGGGAGGTVMFKSTLFSAAGGTINASGGASAGGAGGNGRYLVSENGSATPNYGARIGAVEEFYSDKAARDRNTLIADNTTVTPNIVGLQGGADVYGLMNNVNSNHQAFATIRNNAPSGAVVAVARLNVAPLGEDYLNHDMLVMINLTGTALVAPQLGVAAASSSFASPLMVRGFANNTAFGGGGAIVLSEIPANSVYATLVSNVDFANKRVNFGFGSQLTTGAALSTAGSAAYLSLPAANGDFNGDGLVDGVDFLQWQRGGSPTPLSASDLNAWKANYGAGSQVKASLAVPEPVGVALLALGAAWLGFCPPARSMRRPTPRERLH